MRFSLISALYVAQISTTVTALWPAPSQLSTGTSVAWISPNVKITYVPLNSGGYRRDVAPQSKRPSDAQLIAGASQRFSKLLTSSAYIPWKLYPKGKDFEPAPGSGTTISSVTITQVPSKGNSTDSVDESYTLKLSDSKVKITAATAQGAMHALTTLTQLFYLSSKGGYYTTQAPVTIQDAPEFSWRGLNVDIARNYEPPSKIKTLIDGLAFNKFNRLHIHATDSQSWPLEIPSIPDLAGKGAYRPDYAWTAADLEDVQSYAYARGVMPYIEIDSPGHTASIAWSQPDLIVGYNQQPWPTFCNEPPCGQVKLNSKATNEFFDHLAADLYPRTAKWSERFHSGGDELNANIYGLPGSGVGSNSSAKIKPALQNFVRHVHQNIRKNGMKPIVWEEMLLNWNLTLEKDVIIQTWLSTDSIATATSQGYKALFGEYSWWYMDCGFGQWVDPLTTNPNTPIVPPYTDYCSPYKSWREIYAYDPTANLTAAQKANVLGGEVHMWGELTDPQNFDGKVWPRASAAAELLWQGPTGPKGVNYTVTNRLADQRERMVAMGFEASVVQMTWCLQTGGESCAQ
ncbi:MAG: hypothetical protein GOMPHAMPRED_006683 [Gomphillus americanus]|uniref:Beta-hexosaminidase n=1 Tax=Gomphillus americanus TaxID=1940652 RepID=A0A8H3IXT2_9LECA|nr:MAG: hypothetical protein GOMPHAMPRED_006683 [Gomphillus americanus]